MKDNSNELTPEVYDQIGKSCVCFNLRRATRLTTQVYDRAFKPIGLKTTQYTLMVSVARNSGVSLSRLARRLGMGRTTLSRNAALLERKGFIIISEGEDRRVQRLFLTEKGKNILQRALPLWRLVQSRLFNKVGEEKAQDLLEGLQNLARIDL